MGDLRNKILERIKREKIEPRPRWHFLLKDYCLRLAFFFSLIIGGFAFCAALTIIIDNDWDIYRYLSVNPVKYFLFSLPYLWIIFIFLFLGLAFYNYKHTKGGYKHETFVVLGLSVIGGIILGSFFHSLGMGRKIDRALAKNVPFYKNIHFSCNREGIWSQPEKGLLGGEIREIEDRDHFQIEDFVGASWEIEGENIFWRGNIIPQKGILVKIVGEKRDNLLFWAREVRLWDSQ